MRLFPALRRPLAAALVLLLAACANVQTAPEAAPRAQKGGVGQAGETMTVATGEPVLSAYDYMVQKVAVTKAPFQRSLFLMANVTIPAGTPLLISDVDGRTAYCTPQPVYTAPGDNRGVCLYDSKQTGMLDEFFIIGNFSGATYEARIPYSVTEAAVGTEGYKAELAYLGRAGGDARFAYREFRYGMQRASFAQDISYRLVAGKPTPVAFRAAKFDILHADNQSITVRIKHGLTP